MDTWKDFRENAGQLVNQGISLRIIAQGLEVTPNTLSSWLVGNKVPPHPKEQEIIQKFKSVRWRKNDSTKKRF